MPHNLNSANAKTITVLAGLIISDQVVAVESNISYVAVDKAHEFTTLSTAYFALSISTSLTTTLLITLRILLVQRAAIKAGMEKYNAYSSVAEILVESAALYSATLLVFVILNTRMNINFYFAQNIHAQVAVSCRYIKFACKRSTGALGPSPDADHPSCSGGQVATR